MQSRHGARPWHVDAADHLDAVDGPTLALDRRVPTIPWAAGLADAMNEHRRAVHEDAVASTLLTDLTVPGTPTPTS